MKRNPLANICMIFAVVGLILILLSIFGKFESNWVLAAGLLCVMFGNIFNLIRLRKEKKTNQPGNVSSEEFGDAKEDERKGMV